MIKKQFFVTLFLFLFILSSFGGFMSTTYGQGVKDLIIEFTGDTGSIVGDVVLKDNSDQSVLDSRPYVGQYTVSIDYEINQIRLTWDDHRGPQSDVRVLTNPVVDPEYITIDIPAPAAKL